MTPRKGSRSLDDELSGSTPPRLRRRSNGAEYVVEGEMLVGRGLECDIVISDGDSISRRHAQLSGGADGLYVIDLGSTNGTHLNGQEVTERTALADGDVLAFDEYAFDVVAPPPPPPPEPVDPEATRLVDREALFAQLGHDPFAGRTDPTDVPEPASAPAASAAPAPPAPDTAAEGTSVPAAELPATAPDPSPVGEPADSARDRPLATDAVDAASSGGRPAWNSGSVADEMADDDWTWPELDDDLEEPLIELADGPSGLGDPLFRDEHVREPAVADRGAGSGARAIASPPDVPDVPDVPVATPITPVAPSVRDATPTPTSSPSSPPVAPVAPIARDARPTPRAAPSAPPPAATLTGAAGATASPDADRAGPDRSDAAAVPGAWASATSLHADPGHTMIAKYVAPRPKSPPTIDPATLDGPALVVGTGDPAGQVLPLESDRAEWIVGSGDECDLHIRHEGVSTRHAVISREGSKWRLCDELSVNGTWVNGNRVNAGYIGDGDDLRFGPVECRLVIPNGARGKPRGNTRSGAARDVGDRVGTNRGPLKMIGTIVVVVLVLATAFLLYMASRG